MISKMMILGNREVAEKAIRAACRPFDSLQWSREITGSALGYLDGDNPVWYMKVLREELEEYFGRPSTAEFGEGVVTIITPTSGTLIRVRHLDVGFDVEVDFGPKGSSSRAYEIKEAAKECGIHFTEEEVECGQEY